MLQERETTGGLLYFYQATQTNPSIRVLIAPLQWLLT